MERVQLTVWPGAPKRPQTEDPRVNLHSKKQATLSVHHNVRPARHHEHLRRQGKPEDGDGLWLVQKWRDGSSQGDSGRLVVATLAGESQLRQKLACAITESLGL